MEPGKHTVIWVISAQYKFRFKLHKSYNLLIEQLKSITVERDEMDAMTAKEKKKMALLEHQLKQLETNQALRKQEEEKEWEIVRYYEKMNKQVSDLLRGRWRRTF